MTIQEQMLAERSRLSSQIISLEKKIETAPAGCLVCYKNGKSFRHYQVVHKKRTYLSTYKDMEIIEELAKKKYLQQLLKDAKNKLTAINNYLLLQNNTDYARTLLSENPHISDILAPFFVPLDKKLDNWAKAPYPSTAGHLEQLIHPGPGGRMYRSKSESMIAYVLYQHRLAFRYEVDYEINGIMYHIDFVIRHPENGTLIYWEHFGMMDNAGYAANIGSKLKDFATAGIFPERNLILTFESRCFPFEIGMAEEIVCRWFL